MLPKGFIVNGLRCGIKPSSRKEDIAIFYSEMPAAAAGVFTSNLVKAAPVLVGMKQLKASRGNARVIIANSGCANACTGERGLADAEMSCATAAELLGCKKNEVLAASTGVIGQFLPMPEVTRGITALSSRALLGKTDEKAAVRAIMTTDTKPKTARAAFNIGANKISVWGTVKGSGMIHPEVRPASQFHATMLGFILTDAALSPKLLEKVLASSCDNSFNCVSVDGDTSTNDTVYALANGASGAAAITGGRALAEFSKALDAVCLSLAKQIAADGEGATRLVEILVRGAKNVSAARKIGATIATSPLVKTAVFGNDANWGRILAAAGRAGVSFDPLKADICIGGLAVFVKGAPVKFSEVKAKSILMKKEVLITVDLHDGAAFASYYTCDLSFDYIKINASYRS
jgi:glutamate N-acetyltransferase/amino-acid N-acetyltransferase